MSWALIVVLFSIIKLPFCAGVNVTFTPPTQCDHLNVSWTGGQPPFEFNFISVYGRQLVQSVDSSAFSDGKGFFQMRIPFPSGTQMLFVMKDATGYPAGTTSSLVSVGPNVGGTKCNTTIIPPDFTFATDDGVQQCQSFQFYDYNGGTTQPVKIMGIIPGDQVFTLAPPKGSTSFNWTANMPSFSTVLFTMVDSAGHRGGVTQLLTVEQTGNSGCLNKSFPAPNPTPPAQVSNVLPPGASQAFSSSGKDKGLSAAQFAGIPIACVVGGITIFAVIITAVRQRRAKLQRRRDAAALDMGEGSAAPENIITPFPPHMFEHSCTASGPISMHAGGALGNTTNLSVHSGIGAIFPSYHPLSNGNTAGQEALDPYEPPDYHSVIASPDTSTTGAGNSSSSRAGLRIYTVTNHSDSSAEAVDEKATLPHIN